MVDLHNPNVIGTMTGVDYAESNKIAQNNSNITVTDTGVGVITADIDGNEILNIVDNIQSFGKTADTALIITQSTNEVKIKGNNVTSALFIGGGAVSFYHNGTETIKTITSGIQAGSTLTEFDVKSSGGEDGITINNNGSVEIFYNDSKRIETSFAGATVAGDLSVSGDLFIDGTTFTINNQQVSTTDNVIKINDGETGAGVTAGSAGLRIDRGSETDYQILFDEPTDTFRVGELGSLQAVGTREDSPTDQVLPYWNNASKRFDTANSRFKINGSAGELYYGAAKVSETTANGITGAVWG